MVRHLPKEEQQRALLYGLGGAFVFRLVAILLAKLILSLWWAQAVGGLYLLFIAIKHFVRRHDPDAKPVGGGLWQTVIAVELADIAFAVDSVLAGVATIGERMEKLWVVYLGAVMGVILLRFVAGFFIRLLDRYSMLDHVAYVIVGWVGLKLALMAGHNFELAVKPNPIPFDIPEMSIPVFWGVLLVIAGVGTFLAVRAGKEAGRDVQAGGHRGRCEGHADWRRLGCWVERMSGFRTFHSWSQSGAGLR